MLTKSDIEFSYVQINMQYAVNALKTRNKHKEYGGCKKQERMMKIPGGTNKAAIYNYIYIRSHINKQIQNKVILVAD